ncbi:hypothetical protein K474DRAFT_1672057 [Panus rudis PR-1116 ss-1]|nr:hypothetical protein K474DRAFT_1672057 [Panus rudis PR-1116 ss-1]
MASRKETTPEPMPSIPPSPTTEEDISKAHREWHEDEEPAAPLSPTELTPKSARARGKQRASPDVVPSYAEEDESTSDEGEGSTGAGKESYPPIKDEEAESRKVEETLRQWELQERQRRKAARESLTSPTNSSFVTDLTRRASELLSSKRSKRPSIGGGGHHHVLRTTEDGALPLDDIDTPAASRNPSLDPGDNPFKTPSASTTSLNEPQQSAIMTASSTTSTLDVGDLNNSSLATPTAKRPTLTASPSQPPPPQPLDLPKPRTPPPRTQTPHANRPPEPLPPLSPTPHPEEQTHTGKPRWWTDWLCGCMESGDQQAGRTNPFE